MGNRGWVFWLVVLGLLGVALIATLWHRSIPEIAFVMLGVGVACVFRGAALEWRCSKEAGR